MCIRDSPTKRAGRLRLCAPPHENGRRPQAPSTFCALRSRKLWDVSGFLHPHDENCRQPQALCAHAHENRGASQALCTPMMKIADSLRLCAPALTKWRDVSGSVHAHDENCRPSQALCARAHENGGTSQALCTPMMKIADSLRLCAPPSQKLGDVSGSVQPHDENCRQSQALCTPPNENWGTSQALCT